MNENITNKEKDIEALAIKQAAKLVEWECVPSGWRDNSYMLYKRVDFSESAFVTIYTFVTYADGFVDFDGPTFSSSCVTLEQLKRAPELIELFDILTKCVRACVRAQQFAKEHAC